jgi:hypothetical protein
MLQDSNFGTESAIFVIWRICERDEMTDIIDLSTNEFRADEIARIIGMSDEYGGERVYKTEITLAAWSGLMGANFEHVLNPEVGNDTTRIK